MISNGNESFGENVAVVLAVIEFEAEGTQFAFFFVDLVVEVFEGGVEVGDALVDCSWEIAWSELGNFESLVDIEPATDHILSFVV